MPVQITMAEGVLLPAERVYQTPLGKFIKTRVKDSGIEEGFKMLCFSACEVDALGVFTGNHNDDCIPDRNISVNMGPVAARTAVKVIEAEDPPTNIVHYGETKDLKDGCVWLVPSTEDAKIWFQASWHALGNYAADDTTRVKLQIDATKEIEHLQCAIEAENHIAATHQDWEV